jgi:hypothetical protein
MREVEVNALACGLKPDEFWRLTAAELDLVFRAHERKVEENQWLAAWHAANIMNVWTERGHTITARDLMGQGLVDATAVASSPDALIAHLEKMEQATLPAPEDDDG